MALGEKVSAEELGGWRLHAEITGLVDQVVDTEEDVFEALRKFPSYMPSHHNEAPPDAPVPAGSGADMDKVFSILPESRTQVYDMKRVIAGVVDKDTLVRVEAALRQKRGDRRSRGSAGRAWASSRTIRCIAAARSTRTRAARSSISSCCATRSTCRSCILVDTPGFQIGTDAERAGAPGKIMNFMNAMTLVTVPQISVIVRKSYGRAYVCMGGGRHSDDIVGVAHGRSELHEPGIRDEDRARRRRGRAGLRGSVREIKQGSDVWGLASVYAAQAVIRPEQTRDYLIRMLDVYRLRMTRGVGQHLMRTGRRATETVDAQAG